MRKPESDPPGQAAEHGVFGEVFVKVGVGFVDEGGFELFLSDDHFEGAPRFGLPSEVDEADGGLGVGFL